MSKHASADVAAAPSYDARGRIREVGLRATAGRIAVLEVMRAAARPLTHNDVVEILGPRGFDRASIYRNLIDLTEAGLATRRDHGDHVWRFESADAEGGAHLSAHPHFVCTDCGDVVCLPEAEITLPRGADAPGALRKQKVEVHIRGQCDDCS